MSHGLQKLLRVERNTPDLDCALGFYRDALGFAVTDADAPRPAWTRLPGLDCVPSRSAKLALGTQHIFLTEFADGLPYPADATSCDLCFQHCAIVVSDMQAACGRVMQFGVTPITQGGPQTLPPSTGSVTAFKFRDPDGHPLELIAFPAGVGDPAWQAPRGNTPTLGIDHTAISVGDVDRSIRFYALLGLQVAARDVNHGMEQQRLDDLPCVAVDVVPMQGTSRTPHLELLAYRQPRGRTNASSCVTALAADRAAWRAQDIDVLLDALDAGGFASTIVASGFVAGATVALLRDPDGHLLVLEQARA
ncbi:MAG TPA: VOC family protein [Rhodanobacteraceae bacterium]